MKYNVIVMENTDERFYSIMGKFLSKREIVKEIGINVWDDDNNKWFVVCDTDDKVMGFASVSIKNELGKINTLYVLPEYRKKGIGKTILSAILKYSSENKILKLSVTSTEIGTQLYEKYNIVKVGTKGKYQILNIDINQVG